jgi:YbbR-like protein
MPKARMIERIFSNLGYKLTALALSLLVWYIVQGEEILEVNAKLDVVIELPNSLALRDGDILSRDITLRGPRLLVGAQQGKSVTAIIRVPSGKYGSLRYRLDKEFIPQWDNRVRLTIHDPYVTFSVEEKVTKSLEVKPSVLGDVADPFTIDEVSSVPASIEVTGPRSDIAKLSALTTEPLDVTGLSSPKTASLGIAKAGLQNVTLATKEVTVSVVLGPKKSVKTILLVPVVIQDSEHSASVRPQTISLTIRAPTTLIDSLGPMDFKASVSAKNLVPGRYELAVMATGPTGVLVQEITPKMVSVEIFNHRKRE